MTSGTAQAVSYETGKPYEMLLVEVEDRVATVTLNRPESGNALNAQLHAELADFWQGARDDDDVWVVILTGAGKRHFCTGADMREASSGSEGRLGSRRVMGLPWPFRFFKPVICALNGTTAGGGLIFAWEAHITIAADHVNFLEPHLSVGQVPASEIYGLANSGLPWNIGHRMALLGTTGERVSAQRMYDLGIVSELVPGDKLLERAREIAGNVMQMSPLATRAYLEGAWQMREDGVGITAGSAHGHELGHALRETEDYSEGPRSFVEKRRPVWKAR
jgi:enoyl-CoA hydratase/carnithine racemase